jgi:hypothetical protein
MAYNPNTGYFYVPANEWQMDLWNEPIAYKRGAAFLGAGFTIKPVFPDLDQVGQGAVGAGWPAVRGGSFRMGRRGSTLGRRGRQGYRAHQPGRDAVGIPAGMVIRMLAAMRREGVVQELSRTRGLSYTPPGEP